MVRRHKNYTSSKVNTTSTTWLRNPFRTQFSKPIEINPIQITNTDIFISIALYIAALCTRFYRLSYPSQIVFDEAHFAAFIHHYLRGEYLFDIHPPFAKLVLSFVAYLCGYDANVDFQFNEIGKPYGDLKFYAQRAVSTITGSAIPSVLYLTCRALDLDLLPCLTASMMSLFDILLCIESRLILTDAQLILYIQLSLLFGLHLWRSKKNTRQRFIYLCLTALFGAFGIATKWTGIVIPGMIGIVSLTGFIFPVDESLYIWEMFVAGLIAIVVYVSTFWIHFFVLPKSGPGDTFMDYDFQSKLIGNGWYQHESIEKVPGFVQSFRYLNWEMLRANNEIEQRHDWESKWYEWLYNARGILYYRQDSDDGDSLKQIYLIVNPIVSIVCGISVIICIIWLVLTPILYVNAKQKQKDEERSNTVKEGLKRLKRESGIVLFLVICWIANLLPYIGVKRCTFLYHILPSLQISIIMTAMVLQKIAWRNRLRLLVCMIIIWSLFEAFMYWSAWIYAIPITEKQLEAMQWMPRWN